MELQTIYRVESMLAAAILHPLSPHCDRREKITNHMENMTVHVQIVSAQIVSAQLVSAQIVSAQIVSGTNCIWHKLYRAQTVSGTNCIL